MGPVAPVGPARAAFEMVAFFQVVAVVSYTATTSLDATEVIVPSPVSAPPMLSAVTSAPVAIPSNLVPSLATLRPSTVPTSVVIFLLSSITVVPLILTAIFVFPLLAYYYYLEGCVSLYIISYRHCATRIHAKFSYTLILKYKFSTRFSNSPITKIYCSCT